jgi:hypothetical protein
MLVSDSFCGHMTERMKVKVNKDSDPIVIPSGMTKLLQPLNVVINCHYFLELDNHEI